MILFLCKTIPLIILYLVASRKYVRNILLRFSFTPLFLISLSWLLYFLFLVGWYATSPLYIDHVEPNIANVTFFFLKGQPLYHSAIDPLRYSFPHGPMLYISNGLFLQLLGPSIFSSKIGGIIAGALSLLFMFMLFRKDLGNRTGIILLGYLTWIYLNFANTTFWNRSDSYILFLVALSLLVLEGKKRIPTAVGLGLILGIVINFKIHTFLYLVPIYFIFYSRHGLKAAILALIPAIAVAVFPFLVFKNINIIDYIGCLVVVSKHPLSYFMLAENLKMVFFYIFLPLSSGILIFGERKKTIQLLKNNQKLIILLSLTTLILIYASAKEGGGIHHMIPLALIYVGLFSHVITKTLADGKAKDTREDKPKIAGAMCVVYASLLWASFFASPIYYAKVMTFSSFKKDDQLAAKIYNDIRKIIDKYPQETMEMGYGGQYAYTYFRPMLTFYANARHPLDAAALMHWQRTGYPFPTKAMEFLRDCRVKVFLIPKGGPPFQINNFFNPQEELFSEEFKKTFYQKYTLKESSQFYDIWACK